MLFTIYFQCGILIGTYIYFFIILINILLLQMKVEVLKLRLKAVSHGYILLELKHCCIKLVRQEDLNSIRYK